MRYTHVLNRGRLGCGSADLLAGGRQHFRIRLGRGAGVGFAVYSLVRGLSSNGLTTSFQ